jgi:hypothetical protein
VPHDKKYEIKHEPTNATTSTITKALNHQNLVGWQQALRGYISRFWIDAQTLNTTPKKPNKKQPKLEHKLIGTFINLHRKIWEERNHFIHGETIAEQRLKARERITLQVAAVYKNPPKLARRYQAITEIPIETRMKQSTQNLQNWIALIKHQQKVTTLMAAKRPPNQMSMQQAVANMHKALNGKQYFPP